MYKRSLLAAMLIAVAAAGCGKKRSGIVAYPVTGTVTYNGKAVAGANISYTTTNPDAPRAGATTDSEGKFSLTTYVSPTEILKGAPPGDYQVVIVKAAEPEKPSGATDQDMATATNDQRSDMLLKQWASQQERTHDPKQQKAKPKPAIPERYGKAETSGLKQTVVSGTNDPVEFKLTDD